MSDKLRGVLEDSRAGLLLKDFSGGLVTDVGGLSLQPNQSPDCQNVFAWEGNLLFAGGYNEFSPLDGPADGAYVYYDISRVRHMVVWRNGNLYDTASGAEVVIASGVYTPGERIAHAQLNGIMYWSTLTVPLRQWNGVTEQAVVTSGAVGSVAPPACSFLIAFNGALVAVSVVVAGVPNLGAFMWSNVNDPTTWLGVNTQVVGSNDGSIAQFAVSLGVAQVGVTPTKQFLVGKSSGNMFLYTGALGSLTEQQVSCPTGCMSGDSAVYIPTGEGFGAVMFLGSDAQFYLCNGVQAPIASKGIKSLVVRLVSAALAQNPDHKFSAVYNARWQYYLVDMGNNYQLAYKWDANKDGGAWWLFKGWPPGYYMSAPGDSGVFSVYVASSDADNLGVFEIALDDTDFNDTALSDVGVYWSSAYIHGGKPERLKIFQDLALFFYNSGVRYKCTVYGMPNSNAVTPTSRPLSFNTPAVGAITQSGGAIWNQAYWNQAYWGGAGYSSLTQPLQIGGAHGPIVVPSAASKWAPAGSPVPLRSGACQIKIEWERGANDFRVAGVKLAFVWQNENMGALPFSGQGQVTTSRNTFTNVGYPPPEDLPEEPAPPPPAPDYYTVALDFMNGCALSADELYLYIAHADATASFARLSKVRLSDMAIMATQTFSDGADFSSSYVNQPIWVSGSYVYVGYPDVLDPAFGTLYKLNTDLDLVASSNDTSVFTPLGSTGYQQVMSDDGLTLYELKKNANGNTTGVSIYNLATMAVPTYRSTATNYTTNANGGRAIAIADSGHWYIPYLSQAGHAGQVAIDRVNISTGAVVDSILVAAPGVCDQVPGMKKYGTNLAIVYGYRNAAAGVSQMITVSTTSGTKTGTVDIGTVGVNDFLGLPAGLVIAPNDTVGGSHVEVFQADSSAFVGAGGVPRVVSFRMPPPSNAYNTQALTPSTDIYFGLAVSSTGTRLYLVNYDAPTVAVLQGLY